jgi:signal transduction histidine kinase
MTTTIIGCIAAAVALATAAAALLIARGKRHDRAVRRELDVFLHQLKNPLQSILLHADLLGDPMVAATEESRAELRSAILGEAQRVASMLNDYTARSTPGALVVPGAIPRGAPNDGSAERGKGLRG